MDHPFIVVIGPTAAGKSDVAVRLALELDAEVISADSVQVYRGFDIGTGKISAEEQQGVPHHLLDVVDPDEPFSAARFVELADAAVADAAARGTTDCGITGAVLLTADTDGASLALHHRVHARHRCAALDQVPAPHDHESNRRHRTRKQDGGGADQGPRREFPRLSRDRARWHAHPSFEDCSTRSPRGGGCHGCGCFSGTRDSGGWYISGSSRGTRR